ncbi:hypothetical protein AJ88_07315 [Mesorhizobium amorphae CCBAU 01583]|nr:hypothetical protein AJ88_07315 [Mesorhizobium amorphae CCBAU 01583]
MFGRVIDAISEHGSVFSTLGLWAGLGAFNIVAFVLVARGADRFAHKRRSEVLCQSFERVITMPLAWHHQRGTSNSLHTLLRAVETLFSLWLEFMRQHLSTVVALALLIPTALSMDVRMSMVLLRSAPSMSASAGWSCAAPRQARQRSSGTTTPCSRM